MEEFVGMTGNGNVERFIQEVCFFLFVLIMAGSESKPGKKRARSESRK